MTPTSKTDETVERLRMLLAREGEAIAPVLAAPGAQDVIAPLVRACAAGRAQRAELALVLESILEGYLLHYGRSRLVDTADEDLRLLAGDHLYALGSPPRPPGRPRGRAGAGRPDHALCPCPCDAGGNGGSPGDPAALWLLSALAVGAGSWPEYRRSLEAAHKGSAGAADLLAGGSTAGVELSVEVESQAALIAFECAVADRPHA